jgi:hypothetical protein
MQHIPPMNKVMETPILLTRLSASRLPKGAMPKKETAKKLIIHPLPSPTAAIKIPATKGPINLVPLNMAEFEAIALPKSSRFSIISTIKDCLAGTSKALTQPMRKLRPIICRTAMLLVRTNTTKVKAWIRDRGSTILPMCSRLTGI